MQITDIHIGQKVLYRGSAHTVETIDGRFGTVTFDGISTRAEELSPAEPSATITGDEEICLLDNILFAFLRQAEPRHPSHDTAVSLRETLNSALSRAKEAQASL